jgi:kinesin family member 2/24
MGSEVTSYLFIHLFRTEEELENIYQDHENLVNLIIGEEQQIIDSHRTHIDQMVELTKHVFSFIHP